jgi:hypothetical protein
LLLGHEDLTKIMKLIKDREKQNDQLPGVNMWSSFMVLVMALPINWAWWSSPR